MERYSSVALEPHLSSVVSGCSSVLIYLLAPPQSTFYQVPLPFTVTVTSRSDNAEEEQSPQMWITYDNQNWLLTGNLFLFLYFFFFRAVNRYPLLHCSKGSVSILASVWCQSTRGKLPSACVSMCVCARAREERTRENGCVCLCVSHCSDWASRGCFKQAALPMWPAQAQAGIHYWDTHALSLSLAPSAHTHTVSTVHPLATTQGNVGKSPHTQHVHAHTDTDIYVHTYVYQIRMNIVLMHFGQKFPYTIFFFNFTYYI